MKKNHLVSMDELRPLSKVELVNTFGGGWWQDFKQGFTDGWNWAKNAISEISSIITIAKKLR